MYRTVETSAIDAEKGFRRGPGCVGRGLRSGTYNFVLRELAEHCHFRVFYEDLSSTAASLEFYEDLYSSKLTSIFVLFYEVVVVHVHVLCCRIVIACT